MTVNLRAFRGDILHFTGASADTYEFVEDGLLLVEGGLVKTLGKASGLLPSLPPGTPLVDHRGQLLCPGFVDAHVHYPQLGAIASHGEGLLDWLNKHILTAEAAFSDPALAASVARVFCDECLRNGTTTAAVYCARSVESVDALFAEAERRNLRLAAGKVVMDRGLPPGMELDSPESAHADNEALISRWHGRGRLVYAVTPRFAPSCSEAALRGCGELLADHPGVLCQTHISETLDEIALALRLFPGRSSYLDIYDAHGLLGPRTILGHALHFDAADFALAARRGATLCPCPTSNFFLGSGLFKFRQAQAAGARIALGTDVGAGTSLSMLKTMAAAYSMGQLQGQAISPFELFHLATRGNAAALGMEDKIGGFLPGMEADIVALDPSTPSLLGFRTERATTLAERLFALAILGDDRTVAATYVLGERVNFHA